MRFDDSDDSVDLFSPSDRPRDTRSRTERAQDQSTKVGCFFLVLFLFLLTWGLYEAYQVYDSRNWTAGEATISKSEVSVTSLWVLDIYYADVTFTYSALKRDWKGHNLHWGSNFHFRRADAELEARRYNVGDVVPVYFEA